MLPIAVTKDDQDLMPGRFPFSLMRRFSDEMDRMLDQFGFRPRMLDRPLADPEWSPDMELFERDGKLFVRIDLPGLTKKDVKVNVVEGMLNIEGERKVEKEEKQEGYYRTERRYGKFFRSLPLPDGAKLDKIQATFKNGVLEVVLPMAEAKKPAKAIDVEVA
jgi:HSP20 family protein